MVRLVPISGENVRDILKLQVLESQRNFVAPNDMSLIEAYIALSHRGQAFPFGIYDGDVPVGFCMIGYGADDDWKDAPAEQKKNPFVDVKAPAGAVVMSVLSGTVVSALWSDETAYTLVYQGDGRAPSAQEGLLRAHTWHDGQWKDCAIYGRLKEE